MALLRQAESKQYWMAKRTKKNTEFRFLDNLSDYVKYLWILIAAGLITASAIFIFIASTKMPDTQELENPDLEASTIIYSWDQREITRLYSKTATLIRFFTITIDACSKGQCTTRISKR